MLHPHGRVHLGSSFLTQIEIQQLSDFFDVLHEPRHHENAYCNFNLFSIRDIHQLATRPHFVKIDADILVQPNWIDYVNYWIDHFPDTILFGPWKGEQNISLSLTGPLVRHMLGRDIRVINGIKVLGGFYVGNTSFFQQQHRFMQVLHEFTYCFKNGIRVRPSLAISSWPMEMESQLEWSIQGERRHSNLFDRGDEDTIRNLTVHALFAESYLNIFDGEGIFKMHPQPSVEGVCT